jgi:soluble lytic murein transglycosylase-like protein
VVSLLNGLSGLGAGLVSGFKPAVDEQMRLAMGGSAATDQNAALTRVLGIPLINSTPAAPAADAAPAAPADATPAPVATAAAAGDKGPSGVPKDYLPIYQKASERTGIPVNILLAQARQESNFDPNVVSDTGGIGLHQIQPSTARNPGYGLQPVDVAALKDPATNINFAADYLKARAGHIDWSDPKQVNPALARYNGGGDPNYVSNVRRYMPTGVG